MTGFKFHGAVATPLDPSVGAKVLMVTTVFAVALRVMVW